MAEFTIFEMLGTSWFMGPFPKWAKPFGGPLFYGICVLSVMPNAPFFRLGFDNLEFWLGFKFSYSFIDDSDYLPFSLLASSDIIEFFGPFAF